MFPFSVVRPVQQAFMNDIAEALEKRQHLIANAPTGLGKTAATLSVTLDYALKNQKTVFFLTPKHSQHQIAVETLRLMKEKQRADGGTQFTACDLIGKKWLCSVLGIEELTTSEFGEYCRAMVKDERCRYYANTRTKNHTLTYAGLQMLSTLKARQPLHAEEAKELAHATCCTYELLSDLARQSSVIIADYYHVFSPLSKALFVRIKKEVKDAIFIVDEAHNLPQRVRQLASRRLSEYTLVAAEREARAFHLSDIVGTMHDLRRVVEDVAERALGSSRESFLEKDVLLGAVERDVSPVDRLIEECTLASEAVLETKRKSAIRNVASFLTSWKSDDKGYARIASRVSLRGEREGVALSYLCLDPRLFTQALLEECHSAIFMSGTLTPLEMYRDLFGLQPERAILRSYQSPFPRYNRLNIFVTDSTTQYTKRTNEGFAKIADHIVRCCDAVPGNVAVFFPSYYLRDAIADIAKRRLRKEIILEQQQSNKAERRRLYNLFIARHEKGAVFMGVMAGSFAEGMDYPGKYLNGVIVVGIPLEVPNLESKALIDYYDETFKRGWDYGYIYPAMTRSIQAAGRCIRSESDRGVCVFVDARFLWGNYRKAFPVDLVMKITNEPEKEIRTFFEKAETAR